MKKIKIRFVKNGEVFLIQKKTAIGWRYISYLTAAADTAVRIHYSKKSKRKLLKKVIEEYYHKNLKTVQIIEYPKLRIY